MRRQVAIRLPVGHYFAVLVFNWNVGLDLVFRRLDLFSVRDMRSVGVLVASP
jgi:hypothetical protein